MIQICINSLLVFFKKSFNAITNFWVPNYSQVAQSVLYVSTHIRPFLSAALYPTLQNDLRGSPGSNEFIFEVNQFLVESVCLSLYFTVIYTLFPPNFQIEILLSQWFEHYKALISISQLNPQYHNNISSGNTNHQMQTA
jgi:hypothetical protein